MPKDDDLDRLRAAVDVCNRRLVAVLQERGALVRRIGACKRARGLPAADPQREQAMLAVMLAAADPAGYPPDALRAILDAVLCASRDLAADPR